MVAYAPYLKLEKLLTEETGLAGEDGLWESRQEKGKQVQADDDAVVDHIEPIHIFFQGEMITI